MSNHMVESDLEHCHHLHHYALRPACSDQGLIARLDNPHKLHLILLNFSSLDFVREMTSHVVLGLVSLSHLNDSNTLSKLNGSGTDDTRLECA